MRFLFFAFLLIPYSTLAQDSYTSQEQELIDLNAFLYTSYALDHNTEPLEKIATDDFRLVVGIGIIEDKTQAIAGVENLEISSIEVLVDEVLVKKNIGIVIGSLTMKGAIMGRPVPGKMRYSSVFVMANGQWKLQLRTMTPIRMKKS